MDFKVEGKTFWSVAGVSVVLLTAFRDFFLNSFFRYVAGPVVADARGVSSTVFRGMEVFSGYNVVNEVLYATLLASIVYLLYRDIGRKGFSRKQMYALMLFPVMGGLLRVVEDTGMVPFPYNIFIISPIGYFLVIALGYTVYRASLKFGGKKHVFCFSTGIIGISAVSIPLLVYGLGNGISQEGFRMLAVTGAVLLSVVLLQKLLSMKFTGTLLDTFEGYMVSLGHGLDGISSAFSIAVMGYGEKHPVSQAIMSFSGTPYGFTVFKVVLILVLLGLLDGEMDGRDRLLVLGVLAVGLGPGVRNLVRAFLGV
mgnify:CR=1 FL=1